MIILGCDPSLTDFGWAVFDSTKPEGEQCIDSGRIRTKAADFEPARYAKHRYEIHEIIIKHKPDFIGIEIPPANASWSAGLYPIWVAIAEFCYEYRIPYSTFLPSQLKSFAKKELGDTGKMFKSDMVDAAMQLWKINKRMNHNIADAMIVGYMAMRLKLLIEGIITEDDLEPHEKHLFTRTRNTRAGLVVKEGVIFKEGTRYYTLESSKYDVMYENKANGLFGDMKKPKPKKVSKPKTKVKPIPVKVKKESKVK